MMQYFTTQRVDDDDDGEDGEINNGDYTNNLLQQRSGKLIASWTTDHGTIDNKISITTTTRDLITTTKQSMKSSRDSTTISPFLNLYNWLSKRPVSRTQPALVLVLSILGLVLLGPCQGFNSDTRLPSIYQADERSYFGYSVLLHSSQGEPRILVGAPTANTSVSELVEPGAVYECDYDTGDCKQIVFDSEGNRQTQISPTAPKRQFEEKSGQWFGATLASSGVDGDIIACGPRYKYFGSRYNRLEPVGICFASSDQLNTFQEISACRDWVQFYLMGYGMCGFTAQFYKHTNTVIIGAPGSFYWQGQLVSAQLNNTEGLSFTSDGPSNLDDRYLGYSLAVGAFTGSTPTDIISGIPRGNILSGQVGIFDKNLILHLMIDGEQTGSLFGSAVAVIDGNGDGLDDLVVGASLYSDPKDYYKYELGRVYVYYQLATLTLSPADVYTGTVARGRFGSSIANIGDLNVDGIDDLAIAAPYGGSDGNGVVYIYNGGDNGLRESQVIAASLFSGLQGFGYSMSGGVDVDHNGYPDLLIGSYVSDHAVLLRSRPIINVESTIVLDPNVINIDKQICHVEGQLTVSCFAATVCIVLSGAYMPDTVTVEFTVTLDAMLSVGKRIHFDSGLKDTTDTLTVVFSNDKEWCDTFDIYLKSEFRDKLSPIAVDVTPQLIIDDTSLDLQPVQNELIQKTTRVAAHILRNCGSDNVCVPNLVLEATSDTDRVLVGADTELLVDVTVTNRGEDAYESVLSITFPHGIEYSGLKKSHADISVLCYDASEENVADLLCDVGNPVPAGTTVRFGLYMTSRDMRGTDSEIFIDMILTSSNEEDSSTEGDNRKKISELVVVETGLTLNGLSSPDRVTIGRPTLTTKYTNVSTSLSRVGPLVEHKYEILNKGPSSISGALISILWPGTTLSGENLLYLLAVETSGPVGCRVPTEIIDPDGILVNGTNDVPAESDRNKRAANIIDCGQARCTEILCRIGFLDKMTNAIVIFTSRLWEKTLEKSSMTSATLSSEVTATVTDVPYDLQPLKWQTVTTTVDTVVQPYSPYHYTRGVPWWVILLAVLVGLLLVLLLFCCCWKCGFLKRKYHQDTIVVAESEGSPRSKHSVQELQDIEEEDDFPGVETPLHHTPPTEQPPPTTYTTTPTDHKPTVSNTSIDSKSQLIDSSPRDTSEA